MLKTLKKKTTKNLTFIFHQLCMAPDRMPFLNAYHSSKTISSDFSPTEPSFCVFNSFPGTEFMYHTIYPFKTYNVILRMFRVVRPSPPSALQHFREPPSNAPQTCLQLWATSSVLCASVHESAVGVKRFVRRCVVFSLSAGTEPSRLPHAGAASVSPSLSLGDWFSAVWHTPQFTCQLINSRPFPVFSYCG